MDLKNIYIYDNSRLGNHFVNIQKHPQILFSADRVLSDTYIYKKNQVHVTTLRHACFAEYCLDHDLYVIKMQFIYNYYQ